MRLASPAIVLDIGREALVSWPGALIAAVTGAPTRGTALHPLILLAAGALLGWAVAL